MTQERTRGCASSSSARSAVNEPPTVPLRVPIAPEKPIHIPNLRKDRLGTFEFISWWEREKVQDAKIMVIGAGALGNEVIKNLSLMGVGNLFIVDFDKIEAANLSRSVLFRETEITEPWRRCGAVPSRQSTGACPVSQRGVQPARVGHHRRMDDIIGCLDNVRRVAVNRFSYWMNITGWMCHQELLGWFVSRPREGCLLRCTLSVQALVTCHCAIPAAARPPEYVVGKVPTTPTLHPYRAMQSRRHSCSFMTAVEAGKVNHFNGMVNEMHTNAYTARDDLNCHWELWRVY